PQNFLRSGASEERRHSGREVRRSAETPLRFAGAGFALLTAFCVVQLLMPLRSWLYPQQGAWDTRGFNFAWRVMLVEKTGDAEFFEFDPTTGKRERIPLEQYISPRQRTMMAQDPFMIRQLAQFLGRKRDASRRGREIRVDAFATLNGRPSQ